MLNRSAPIRPPKRHRPELTRLPELTPERVRYRQRFQKIARFLIKYLTRPTVFGLENFPAKGPGLIVANHLGDADMVIALAYLPVAGDGMGKIELYDLPIFGTMLDRYGIIWVHRRNPDRRALRAVQQGFDEGRFIAIAPEGRQSRTHALEEGHDGAAYLALKSNVPVIPVTFTGTEDNNVYFNLLTLRRPRMTLTVGPPFRLEQQRNRKQALAAGTERIMRTLAAQLPPKYRGVYADFVAHQ